ncbi:MAG TPA: response regulator [Cyclobacteriaceae bacterium]|nr:response regulator [Cyclobacteriaceae bacterium]
MSTKIEKLDCVLLIDDDEATNFYHSIVVEEECERVHIQAVKSAKEGLDYLLRRGSYANSPKPGIIFLDINMPGMSGWDFLNKYIELSEDIHQRAVVAMLTTSVNPDDQEKAKSIPLVKEFVHKPLTNETFRKILNENFTY